VKSFNDYLETVKSIKFITVNDHEELDKVFDWAESQGKKIGTLRQGLHDLKKFPLYLNVDGDVVGWTDHGDRAAGYISFDKWWIIK